MKETATPLAPAIYDALVRLDEIMEVFAPLETYDRREVDGPEVEAALDALLALDGQGGLRVSRTQNGHPSWTETVTVTGPEDTRVTVSRFYNWYQGHLSGWTFGGSWPGYRFRRVVREVYQTVRNRENPQEGATWEAAVERLIEMGLYGWGRPKRKAWEEELLSESEAPASFPERADVKAWISVIGGVAEQVAALPAEFHAWPWGEGVGDLYRAAHQVLDAAHPAPSRHAR
ncbi:hypothetical protein ACQEU5_25120 [Marinactinospora thermotolerans]|uniref:hypothetical protein n=1 Tax=Marinactinospora thermotolerans TaxID=531310 RepID=UPI003D8F35B9